MAARPPIQIKYNIVDTYPDTAQKNWIGAQIQAGHRGWWNDFNDASGPCRAMHIAGGRYLYYASGAALKRRDILLASTITIGLVGIRRLL